MNSGKKNFITYMISLFLINLAINMQGSTLQLYALELGGNEAHIGMLSGIGSLAALFFRPFAGTLLDKSRRTFIFIVGLAIYVMSSIGYAVSPNTLCLVISRGLYGIGLCAASSAIAAIVSDITSGNLVNALQTVNVVQTIGSLFAPMIGIFLAGVMGYVNMYFLTAALFVAAIGFAWMVDYDRNVPIMRCRRKADENVAASLAGAETERGLTATGSAEPDMIKKKTKPLGWKVLLPSLCMVFHGIPHCAVFGFIASYGLTVGIENVGFYYLVNGLTAIAVKPILSKFTDAEKRDKMFGVGTLLLAWCVLSLMYAQGPVLFVVSAMCFGAGYAATQPTLNALALMSVEPDRRGSANATYYIFWDFGYGAGSIFLGVIAKQFGYHTIYKIGIASLFILWCVYRKFIAGKYRQTR